MPPYYSVEAGSAGPTEREQKVEVAEARLQETVERLLQVNTPHLVGVAARKELMDLRPRLEVALEALEDIEQGSHRQGTRSAGRVQDAAVRDKAAGVGPRPRLLPETLVSGSGRLFTKSMGDPELVTTTGATLNPLAAVLTRRLIVERRNRHTLPRRFW